MTSYDDDLRLAHVLADAVERVTMARFRAPDLVVESKPDLTPVTDADLHAYAEVYLGDRWYIFDPSGISPRMGLLRIATGRDATEVAFATIFGTVQWNMPTISIRAEGDAANGIVEPAFVKPEFAFVLAAGGNSDGTFDYNPNSNPNSAVGNGLPNLARAGIHLQGLFYAGVTNVNDARVVAAKNYISSRWAGTFLSGDYTGTCGVGQNKACAYGMYNAFKGLKLLGITSLPAAADWYAEYQDWLVANQHARAVAAA